MTGFPDLTALPLQSIIGLLVIFGAVDTIGSILIAIGAGSFNAEYTTGFLRTHVAQTWFPIAALGLVGVGVPALSIPPIPFASLAAAGALAAYGVQTLGSLKGSLLDKSVAP